MESFGPCLKKGKFSQTHQGHSTVVKSQVFTAVEKKSKLHVNQNIWGVFAHHEKSLFIPINSTALPLSMYVQQFITIKVIYSFLDVLMFACFLVSYGYVVLNSECKSRVVRKILTKMIVYDVVAAAVFVIDASGRDFAREKVMHMSTNAHIYVSTGTHWWCYCCISLCYTLLEKTYMGFLNKCKKDLLQSIAISSSVSF